MNENTNDIDLLLTRVLAGDATNAETSQVASWRQQSAENERKYQDLRRIVEVGRQSANSSRNVSIDVDSEWDTFTKKVGLDNSRSMSNTGKKSMGWLRMAAAVLILVSAGLIIDYLLYKNDVLVDSGTSTLAYTLPDSSSVTLNRRSSLLYKPSFGESDRTVELEGEAFFDVKPDSQKPFIVITKSGTVTVVGTSFSVQSYDSLATVDVIVQTGIVSFHVPSAQGEVRLDAGERAVLVKASNTVSKNANSDLNFLSWKTQTIHFEATPLKTVMETIAKTYNVRITSTFEIPESCTVTATFDKDSLDAVLRVLENTLNLTLDRKENEIIITGGGC